MTHDKDSISDDDVEDEEPRQISYSSKSKWMRCFFLLIVVLAYLFAGALVFRALERPLAIKAAKDFDAALLRLASENDCMDESDVAELMDIVTRAIGEGGYDSSLHYAAQLNLGFVNDTFFSNMWSIGNTYMFVATVVTTIGFGYTAPRTGMGQFVCMVYAVIGILLTGGIFLSVGEIIKALSLRKAKCTKNPNTCMVRQPQLWSTGVVLFNILLALLTYLLMMTPTSLIYYYLEDWSYLDSHYLSVVLMTTIGFGDQQATYPTMPILQKYVLTVVHFTYFFICFGALSTMFETFSRAQHRAADAISSCLSRYHRQQRLHKADIELETQGMSSDGDDQGRSKK